MATRARTFRFTIRTLLLVGLIVSLALGWWTERQSRSTLMEQNREISAEFDRVKKVLAFHSERQRIALAEIRKLGGLPITTTPRGLHVDSPQEDQLVVVPYVDLSNPNLSRSAIRAMLPHLADLLPAENEPGRTYVAISVFGNPNVDQPLLEELRALPNCDFSRYWFIPPEVVEAIQPGMDQEQVVQTIASRVDAPQPWSGSKRRLGLPTKTYRGQNRCETWTYYTDPAGVSFFGVDFDTNDRVLGTWYGRGKPSPDRGLTAEHESQRYR